MPISLNHTSSNHTTKEIREIKEGNYSVYGKIGAFVSAAILFSIDINMRIAFGDLQIHPYLLLLPIFIFLLRFDLLGIPTKVLTPLLFFFALFTIASIQDNNPFSEPAKVLASIVTFLFFVQTIKRSRDLELVALGFILVGVVMGVLAYQKSLSPEVNRLEGINVIEGLGNKNAQSLYTLPGLFFASWFAAINYRKGKYLISIIYIGSVLAIIVSIALSANRSGWVGLLIIFVYLLLSGGLKQGNIVMMIVVSLGSFYIVEMLARDVVERKVEVTTEGYISDEGRRLMFINSLQIGLENPILGLGKDKLGREIPRRIGRLAGSRDIMDAHNLYGYLMGAGGIIASLFFFRFLYKLAYPVSIKRVSSNNKTKFAQKLIIGFLLLFLARSLFSREILYSPTFIGSLGAIFGFFMLQIRMSASKSISS